MSVYRFYGFYVHNWDDEAMAGCVMTTLRSHDLVRRPIYVGFPALRAAARWATEWRAISLGFESVWKYRDTSNYGLGECLGSSAIMKLLIIPCRTLAYISSICDSQNISFVQLNFSMEVSVTLMRSIGRTWKPSRCGGFSRPWWLWMAVAVDEGLSHVSMMLRCKVSSWVPLLVA